MKKISALIIAAAGVLNAQTYDYDPSSETLVITGKGNSVADRISFEGPTTPGSTVPGSTEIFGDTKTIILKDVWSSPDSIRVKYIEPTSAGNGTTLKLINSRLGASGDFDMGGSGQTLILDAQSSLNLYGNRLTNTTRIESDGYIETVNGTVSKSSYLWDNKTGTGSSGVLGGRGYYDFGNVSSIDTDKDFGLIKSRGRITDLEISGEYTVGGDSGKTLGDDSFFAGVNAEDTTGGQAMTISGKLTVAAKQGTGIGVRANQLGDDDVSLENNYSGEITVRAKDVFGVKVGGNAAKDAATAGDIHSISIGTLNVESTASGSDTGTATGIYAKSVKRGLTANSITVKGYTDAAGIQLTEGGRNLSITDMKVSAGADGTATGILASASVGAGVSSMGDLENINVGNLEVSGGADAAGILAKSVLGRVDNISASSTNGTANGIHADTIDITVGCKISASSENGDADGIFADNDIKLTILDGAEISATAENGEAFAIRSASGNIDLNFAGTATINGNVNAKDITLSNGGLATINGDVEGDNLAAGAEIGTVSGKMKFDTVADLTVATSVGSLEIGTAESITAAKIAGDATVDTVSGKLTVAEGKNITINVSAGELLLGTVENLNVAKVNGTTDIITATGDVVINDGGDVFVRDSAGSLMLGKVGNVGAAKVVGSTTIDQAGDVTIIEGGDVTVNTSADSLSLGTVESVYAAKVNGDTIIEEASQNVHIVDGQNASIGSAGSLALDKVGDVGVAKVNGDTVIGEAKDITIIDGKNVWVNVSADSLTLGKVDYVEAIKINGDTVISEASQTVRISEGQNVTIGSANMVELGKVANVGIAKINGNANIDEAGDITIVEGKGITVSTSANSLSLGKVESVYAAKVNGDTIIEEASQNVYIVDGQNASIGSAGLLNVDKLGGNLTVAQVGETAVDSVVGDVVIGTATGNVSVSNSSSATVVNASGDISATNISNGLTVGNVGNVNVSNADVNVLDGGTLGGDIVSSTDLTLTNGGTATIAGSVSAGSNRLTIGSAFNVNSSAATVISAGTLSGAGLRDTINNHYDSAFGFSATDDSAGTLTAATSLKGVHNVSSNNITGTIEGDLASVENAYTKIKYVNVGNNVGYEVESNTYLTDAVATNETERAYAEIYDNLEYVEGDDAANATSVAKKRNFVAMVNGGTLGALNPQSVVHGVRMNMDLADIIHLDTLNRTSSSADALAAADHAERPSGDANITVRNINRFASYGGDGNIDGSNDYISGGLVNVEYAVNREFFAGLGAGGFQSKSTGKGNCGKAETQSFAVNAYADWRFFDNFDWYFGATYAFGMNEAERANIVDRSKAEWDSNLVGVFTGVRYAWKPFLDREFYVKPTIGANANFLMNPSFDEKSGAERMHFDSDRYTSVKSLVGIEATYALANGFYFAGRMFYTHEFCDERYDVNSMFGATAIRTRGWEMDRDAGVFGAGLGYNITDQWRVYADYAAEVSGRVYHNLNAGIQFRF